MGRYETCFVQQLLRTSRCCSRLGANVSLSQWYIMYVYILFTCVGQKAENIGRRPSSTSPHTCCPLVTSHRCSRDRLFTCKSTCNNHGVGCRCPWLEGACCSSCCPVKKKKKNHPFPLHLCLFFFFLKNESITRFLREITILDEWTVVYHPKFEDTRLADPRRKSKTQPV